MAPHPSPQEHNAAAAAAAATAAAAAAAATGERIPPSTTLRSATLRIGTWSVAGDDAGLTGNGLEVRFLYGRRRKLQYDWVVGPDRADAAAPRGRMQVDFDAIYGLAWGGAARQRLRVAVAEAPIFFIDRKSVV